VDREANEARCVAQKLLKISFQAKSFSFIIFSSFSTQKSALSMQLDPVLKAKQSSLSICLVKGARMEKLTRYAVIRVFTEGYLDAQSRP
jgi:hypothetical protein